MPNRMMRDHRLYTQYKVFAFRVPRAVPYQAMKVASKLANYASIALPRL